MQPDSRPPVKHGKITRMIPRNIFGYNIPEPAIQRSRRRKIPAVTDLLPHQFFFYPGIDPEFICYTITEIETTEDQSEGSPELSAPVAAFQDQQGQERDPRPHRIKRIRHEQHVKRNPVMTEGFEPARAIRIESIEKDMHQKLQSEKKQPSSQTHHSVSHPRSSRTHHPPVSPFCRQRQH